MSNTDELDGFETALRVALEQIGATAETIGEVSVIVSGPDGTREITKAGIPERQGLTSRLMDALTFRSQDVHLLGHQGVYHRSELDKASWDTCPLDPCVADRVLIHPPEPTITPDTLEERILDFLGLLVRKRLDDFEATVAERTALLRSWFDARRGS